MNLEATAEILNRVPEVAWDRYVAYEEDGERLLSVFGWISRDDGRHDFIVLKITDDLRVGFTTSSAELTETFSDRLYGDHDTHEPCQRVETLFGDLVPNAIRLEPSA